MSNHNNQFNKIIRHFIWWRYHLLFWFAELFAGKKFEWFTIKIQGSRRTAGGKNVANGKIDCNATGHAGKYEFLALNLSKIVKNWINATLSYFNRREDPKL